MKIFLILVTLYTVCLNAESFNKRYTKGTGSKFELETSGLKSEITLIVVDSTADTLTLEYGITSSLVQLWQQFKLKVKPGKRLEILQGFQQAGNWEHPERIAEEKIKQLEALGFEDFLLTEEELAGLLVAEETIETPAGSTKGKYFKRIHKGGTTEYWLSEDAKPFKIAKIKSEGKLNYDIKLKSLVKGAKPKIDASKALPPSEKGNELFFLSQTASTI